MEETGIFDTIFSRPAKQAIYLILANVEEAAKLHHTYIPNRPLPNSEQSRIRRIIKYLNKAIQLTRTASEGEAFLIPKALSIKIFLETLLRNTIITEERFEDTAAQLMEALQKPEQQRCSSLVLCSSLECVFWQTMMGAIAAPDARIKKFYTLSLRRISIALALTSWQDALVILQRFLWIPSVLSALANQTMAEILHPEGPTSIEAIHSVFGRLLWRTTVKLGPFNNHWILIAYGLS